MERQHALEPQRSTAKQTKAETRAKREAAFEEGTESPILELHRTLGNRAVLLMLGAERNEPYVPGEESRWYEALPPKQRSEINAEVDGIMRAQGLKHKLDWNSPRDRPSARQWLRLRDEVVKKAMGQSSAKTSESTNGQASLFEKNKAMALTELHKLYSGLYGKTAGTQWAHQDFVLNLLGFWGTISEVLGRVKLPSLEIWESPLGALGGVRIALAELKEAATTEEFQTRLHEVKAALVSAAEAYNSAYEQWYEYREGSIKGAERGKIGVEIVAGIAVSVATGSVAAGTAGVKLLAATIAGVEYGLLEEAGMQVFLKERFDPGALIKRAGKEIVFAMMDELLVGRLAEKFKKAFGAYLADIGDEVLAEISRAAGTKITRDVFLTTVQKHLVELFENVVVPNVLKGAIESVLTNLSSDKPPSSEEILQQILEEMWKGGIKELLADFVKAKMQIE